MASKSKLWYLNRMDLFRHMNMDAMKLANQISVMTELKKRTPVYLPGDPADKIYLIKRGVVKISTLTDEGKEIVLAFLHPGDVFGELAVVDASPRDHFAEIYEDALICIFARNEFLQFMKRYPDLAFQVDQDSRASGPPAIQSCRKPLFQERPCAAGPDVARPLE